MENPLRQVEDLNKYIRELHKIGSKMEAGQFFAAFRSVKRIESELEKRKNNLIESELKKDLEE